MIEYEHYIFFIIKKLIQFKYNRVLLSLNKAKNYNKENFS